MKTASDIEYDLAVQREFILDLIEQRYSLRKGLLPYWSLRKALKQEILETYQRYPRGHIKFSFAGKDKRRAIYDHLMDLAEEYGEVAEQYRDVNADLKAAVRERKQLERRLLVMQQKGRLF